VFRGKHTPRNLSLSSTNTQTKKYSDQIAIRKSTTCEKDSDLIARHPMTNCNDNYRLQRKHHQHYQHHCASIIAGATDQIESQQSVIRSVMLAIDEIACVLSCDPNAVLKVGVNTQNDQNAVLKVGVKEYRWRQRVYTPTTPQKKKTKQGK